MARQRPGRSYVWRPKAEQKSQPSECKTTESSALACPPRPKDEINHEILEAVRFSRDALKIGDFDGHVKQCLHAIYNYSVDRAGGGRDGVRGALEYLQVKLALMEANDHSMGRRRNRTYVLLRAYLDLNFDVSPPQHRSKATDTPQVLGKKLANASIPPSSPHQEDKMDEGALEFEHIATSPNLPHLAKRKKGQLSSDKKTRGFKIPHELHEMAQDTTERLQVVNQDSEVCSVCGVRFDCEKELLGDRHMCRVYVKYRCLHCGWRWNSIRGRYDVEHGFVYKQYCAGRHCRDKDSEVETWFPLRRSNTLKAYVEMLDATPPHCGENAVTPLCGLCPEKEESESNNTDVLEIQDEDEFLDLPSLVEAEIMIDLTGRWNDSVGPVAELCDGSLRLLPDGEDVPFRLHAAKSAVAEGVRCLISFKFCGEQWCGDVLPGGRISWSSEETWFQVYSKVETRGASTQCDHRI